MKRTLTLLLISFSALWAEAQEKTGRITGSVTDAAGKPLEAATVQAMKAGCHTVTRSTDGLVERHRIASITYKSGCDGGCGEPAEWITIAPVARAIAVIERLSAAARGRRHADGLWPVLKDRPRTNTHLAAQAILSINTTLMQLTTTIAQQTSSMAGLIENQRSFSAALQQPTQHLNPEVS